MKKIILILSVISTLVLSCNKTGSTQETDAEKTTETTREPQPFTVDSLSVNDSTKINPKITVAFKSKILTFPTLQDKTLLDSIYSYEDLRLDHYDSKSLLTALKKKQENYFKENKEVAKDLPIDYEQTWSENSDMKIFSMEKDLLTIKYTGDGFTGGAHGYYYECYKVFDLKNKKTIQLADVLVAPESDIWKRALWDNFIKNDSGKGQGEMLLVKEISPNNNFYFNEDYLYFLYNQYEIAAYAAGTILIKIPVSDVKVMLKPEFKERMGIK
ncbi:RsiV family protein [Chryseobacterium koreense]|uniref:RsiV family protein n=1 Tax=Chryseobacterium koreense TaxID=232216 RepID=UPI0026EBA5E0|nr:RsiV family protein [Chryseobacterium koreense]